MADNGKAAYQVSVTGVRDYEGEQKPPPKSKKWQFSHMVETSQDSVSGALKAMGKKFFDLYPANEGFAILVPIGDKGGSFITSPGGLASAARGESKGDSLVRQNPQATLAIRKLRALSGETPTHLTPRSEKEYSEALEGNMEAYTWWEEPTTYMQSPIYVHTKGSVIKYRGAYYLRMAAPASVEEMSEPDLRAAFDAQMKFVVDEIAEVSTTLMESGKQLEEKDPEFHLLVHRAAKRTFDNVLKGLLGASDIAKVLAKKLVEKQQVAAEFVGYRGATYQRVADQSPWEDNSLRALGKELRIAAIHLEEIIKDSERVMRAAKALQKNLRNTSLQVMQSVEEQGQVTSDSVDVLQPELRVERYTDIIKSLDKSNRMLNYTVDAAMSAIKASISQLDVLVDEWDATKADIDAPNTKRKMTKPMVMTDSVPAVETMDAL